MPVEGPVQTVEKKRVPILSVLPVPCHQLRSFPIRSAAVSRSIFAVSMNRSSNHPKSPNAESARTIVPSAFRIRNGDRSDIGLGFARICCVPQFCNVTKLCVQPFQFRLAERASGDCGTLQVEFVYVLRHFSQP